MFWVFQSAFSYVRPIDLGSHAERTARQSVPSLLGQSLRRQRALPRRPCVPAAPRWVRSPRSASPERRLTTSESRCSATSASPVRAVRLVPPTDRAGGNSLCAGLVTLFAPGACVAVLDPHLTNAGFFILCAPSAHRAMLTPTATATARGCALARASPTRPLLRSRRATASRDPVSRRRLLNLYILKRSGSDS